MSSETVNCPACSTTFELWESGGYCTNPDCGQMHPKARQESNDAPTDSEDDSASSKESSPLSDASDDGSSDVGSTDEFNLDNDGDDGISGMESASTETANTGTDTDTFESADGDIECSNCGESISPDAGFCQHCGTEVEMKDEDKTEPPTTCPNCGADVEPEQNFCMECGTELTPTPDEAEYGSQTEDGTQTDPQSQTDTESAHMSDESTSIDDQSLDNGESSEKLSNLPQIEFVVDGEQFQVYDGDLVGSEFRRAHVNTGGDQSEARFIHREHIEIEVRNNGVYLIDHGQNATRVNDTQLISGDEQEIEEGDTIELGGVVTADVHIS